MRQVYIVIFFINNMKQLTEKEAEKLLEKEGFRVAERDIAKTKEDLKKIEKKIKFPWAMKASSSKIVHKARIGGVKLSIKNLKEAGEAFEEISKIEDFEEVLIQEMVMGNELIIGLKKTPEFSHILMFGKGGTRVEEEKEVVFRVLPLTKKDIDDMIKETEVFLPLKKEGANIKEIEKVIRKVGALAEKYKNISEFEINPLFVNEKEAVVVDARFLFE